MLGLRSLGLQCECNAFGSWCSCYRQIEGGQMNSMFCKQCRRICFRNNAKCKHVCVNMCEWACPQLRLYPVRQPYTRESPSHSLMAWVYCRPQLLATFGGFHCSPFDRECDNLPLLTIMTIPHIPQVAHAAHHIMLHSRWPVLIFVEHDTASGWVMGLEKHVPLLWRLDVLASLAWPRSLYFVMENMLQDFHMLTLRSHISIH